MRSFIRKTSKILEDSAIVFLLVLFTSVFIQIVMRNFFSKGSVVLEELARFSLVSLVFLMIPALVVDKQHIIVDILLARMKGQLRRIVEILIQVLSLSLSVFLLLNINQVMALNWSVRTPAMRMPNIIFYIPITLGLLFMGLGALMFLVDAIRNKEAV